MSEFPDPIEAINRRPNHIPRTYQDTGKNLPNKRRVIHEQNPMRQLSKHFSPEPGKTLKSISSV